MTTAELKGIVCKTQHEIIVAHLWHVKDWVAEPMLASQNTAFGFIGSAGHTRARELARNECADKLKDKVERARGSEIGRDRRYTYFRYKKQPTREDHQRIAREAVREFDDYQPSMA